MFLAVCNTATMSAAARSLGMTQPAVSQAISELERKTDTTLFDRSARPLVTTVAGSVLRERASLIVAEAREIPARLRETQHGRVPSIRIGLVDSLSRSLSVPLAHFLASRAGEISILSGLTANHASDLLTRRLDLFLGVDDLEDVAGLERWKIVTEPYTLLLPAKCDPPSTVREFKSLADKMPFIRYSARSRTGIQIDRHLRRIGLEPSRSFEFDSPHAVAAMVASGAGFAVSTKLCLIEAKLPRSSIKMAPLPGPQFSRDLTLIARHRELGSLPRDVCGVAKQTLLAVGIGDEA